LLEEREVLVNGVLALVDVVEIKGGRRGCGRNV
jgi:hypothetical protein